MTARPDLALDLLTRLSTSPLPAKLLAADVGVPVRRAGGYPCLLDLISELRQNHSLGIEARNSGTLDGFCVWVRKADWPRAMMLAQLYLNGEDQC